MQMIVIHPRSHYVHWTRKVVVDVQVTFNGNGLQSTSAVPFFLVLNGTVFNQWREVRPLSHRQPWQPVESERVNGRLAAHKWMQQGVSQHGDHCIHKRFLLLVYLLLFQFQYILCVCVCVLDCAIHRQCKCSLIPLILEGEFIRLQCWQVNEYSAVCLCFGRASVRLYTFHAWLIWEGTRGAVIEVARPRAEEVLIEEL